MQLAVQPAAYVSVLTCRCVTTKSFYLVITKISFVYCTTSIRELPFPMDNSLIIIALKEVPVFKSDLSLAMFLVFEPFAYELSPTRIFVRAEAMLVIILPLACVFVPICEPECSFTVCKS